MDGITFTLNDIVMINAAELRIGNFINTGYCKTQQGVLCEQDVLIESVIETGEEIDFYAGKETTEAILLTQEWLLKFSLNVTFKVDAYDAWIKNNVFYIENGNGGSIDFDIPYVHQLQNLFFSLTGTELTIKQLTNA